ncbi:hypothetical protein MSAN_01117200 [Mycena sanguinolenta]|uniref:Fruit-body specific protein a n=1 Tax=Mycena sanguinolenta TaxID=230812 RepID=A0A8H6YMD3_9AGAR|nr:hypothetical protein MSAN_01117200 [Mycena sanguinolenta]
MPRLTHLFLLAALLTSARAVVAPGDQGAPQQVRVNIAPPTPDNTLIAQTANQVDQKSGVPLNAPPNLDVPPTMVTAVDGKLTNTTIPALSALSSEDRRDIQLRQSGYQNIFQGLPPNQHDAAIEGTAYLTYTVVNNATYNIQACTDWCNTIEGCVFVNLYYEFNNYLLDFVFSEKSNLKCAAYGDVHGASEKTNFGGQPSYPQVGNETVPLTFITQSSGWAVDSLVDPSTPDGYEFVFGPTGGANNAPGYMGFAFIDKYDVDACAALCNTRGSDPVGGVCQYFNIWRAVVDGVPTTYTCAMYYLPSNASTAVNFGQGDLVVTFSRGYARTSILPDGGFEGFTSCSDFCFTTGYANWVGKSAPKGTDDATFFFFPPYARTGHGSALLGAALEADSLSGTISPAKPLNTRRGTEYLVQCFMSSAFSGPAFEAQAKVDILWNGVRIGGVSGFSEYEVVASTAPVVGTGKDVLSFVGGAAPAWTFIDDCTIFEA